MSELCPTIDYITERYPIPSKEDEQRFFAQHVAGDKRAANKLVLGHIRYFAGVVGKYSRHMPGHEMDLLQEAIAGAMKALDSWDPDKGMKFVYWAGLYARVNIHAYIGNNTSIVFRFTTSAPVKDMMGKIFSSDHQIKARMAGGWVPYLSKTFGHKEEAIVDFISKLRMEIVNLDHSVDGADGDAHNLVADTVDVLEEIILREEADKTLAMLGDGTLDDREAKIIQKRYTQDESPTLRELGVDLGITYERVRQLEHRAINKMRRAAA